MGSHRDVVGQVTGEATMRETGQQSSYGLKDLQCPWIQFQGSLGDCYREAKGMGLCGLYRREASGWISIAKRYWAEFTPQSKIVDVA